MLGVLLALKGCAPQTGAIPTISAPVTIPEIDFTGRVTRITDGDTFWLNSREVSIRVWGLDAPERGKPGGSAATAELTRLIADRALQCRQRDIDRYRRIVGQCFLADGRDIAAAMISAGVAQEYCRYSRGHYGTCRKG